ncbi:hypothetical protein Tco_0784870 [Tanacetum coccineum]
MAMEVILEPGLKKEVGTMGPLVNKRRRKRGNDEAEANAPPKVLRKDHATFCLAQSTLGGKSLALMGLDAGSIISMPTTQDTPTTAKGVSDPGLLSYTKPQSYPERDIAQSSRKMAIEIPTGNVATTEVQGLFFTESPKSRKSTFFLSVDGSLGEAEVHDLHNQKKNLETLLEAEVDMKKAVEAKNAGLAKELESLRVQFSDLQVSNNQLSQQVSNLQAQVTGEEKIKAAFEEFKKYEDDRVEQHCTKMDARLDKLGVDFDEELYLHMLTAIAGRR